MTTERKADQTLDYRGLLCPVPIMKIAKAIKTVQVGQVVEMLADDPGAPADMKAWTKQTGHELLDSQEEGGTFRFLIRRAK